MSSLIRKSHFLGAKFRGLRKRHGFTLQDVSARCIQVDAETAPSVSYLSMIETGKRVPSEPLLNLLAGVFQKDPAWFLDQNAAVDPTPDRDRQGGAARVPLEPGFLFSRELLESAIPELLSQTGTSGRQFAHLLIRSYQETARNDFPDLERSAEEVGERRFPLSVDDLLRLCRKHGMEVRWFDRKPLLTKDKNRDLRSVVRSFFEPPGTIYANRELQKDPARLKFDLAAHIAHKVLHGGDGLKSPHATGGEMGGSPESPSDSGGMDTQDVLAAWRDFECSFFAGALLCPKQPFRRFLNRESYRVTAAAKLELTPAVIMRRMTAVSPYRYWHFFDAYPPGFLRAVYRGNGIPLPWGNMAMVTDPCPRWAVFRMLRDKSGPNPASQVSILQDGERSLLYCCHSLRVKDMAGNPHVLSVGIDLVPALESQDEDAEAIVASVADRCLRQGGQATIPKEAARAIGAVGGVLNIAWVGDALEANASIICPRSTACPRTERCEPQKRSRITEIEDVREEILASAGKHSR